jgi:hypothetical protein
MHKTDTPTDLRQPIAGGSADSKLNWLLTENQREANRLHLFRNSSEEEELLLMRHPISTEKAYELFGLLLGALPPLAIFWRIFGGQFLFMWALGSGLSTLLLIMSVICCLVGKRVGALMGRRLDNGDNASWMWQLFMSSFAGMGWGVITGAAGGFPAFGIGAVYGAICAVPVGVLAFPFFTLLHHPLTRGGMIDARHFWPLACGVVLTITALILGM